jgi:hypothetical protein
MLRAARLKPDLFEEVEADSQATGQAMGVVVLSSVAAGIGTIGTSGINGLVIGTIVALIGWYVWAFITYYVGTRILPEPQTRADYGELLRTIGFASAPGVLRILAIIPGLASIVFFVCGAWMLVAMVIAVRQALDYHSTMRAVGVCVIGWIIQMVLMFIVLALFGGLAGNPAPETAL